MQDLTKLDAYDYEILPGVVRIKVDSTHDPTLVDIMSELERSKGYMYVEGNYYLNYDYEVYSERRPNGAVYLDLKVVQTQ